MCKSRLFLCYLGVLSFSLIGQPVSAQKPATPTPAVEGICSQLKADGVTKGLFGLCVAFCEAHGAGDQPATISRGKSANRQSSAGSARVLENYKRMKKRTDPDMPCLSNSAPTPNPGPVAQPCPCWTSAQADAVDGVLSDGSTAVNWSASTNDPFVCGAGPEFPFINESGPRDLERKFIRAADFVSGSTVFKECQYVSVVGGGMVANTMLKIGDGNLTAEQLAACKADIFARQAALGICQ